jgi:hypothetical protein
VKGPATRTPSAERKGCGPDDRHEDSRDPQQVDGESCAEEDQHQKSQQNNCHDFFSFLS